MAARCSRYNTSPVKVKRYATMRELNKFKVCPWARVPLFQLLNRSTNDVICWSSPKPFQITTWFIDRHIKPSCLPAVNIVGMLDLESSKATSSCAAWSYIRVSLCSQQLLHFRWLLPGGIDMMWLTDPTRSIQPRTSWTLSLSISAQLYLSGNVLINETLLTLMLYLDATV